jgi:hypothetical protein
VGSVDTPYSAQGIALSGTAVYVADWQGLVILSPQCELTPVLLTSFTPSVQSDGIMLRWTTSGETAFSGFHVDRSLRADGGYERQSSQLLLPPSPYRFLDTHVVPAVTYYYRLEALDRTGSRELFGPIAARWDLGGEAGLETRLGHGHPNPFIGNSVTIPFVLAREGDVMLRILDISGRQVRLLKRGQLEAGRREVFWDGRNDRGTPVAAGIYFYELETPGYRASRRLVRLQ